MLFADKTSTQGDANSCAFFNPADGLFCHASSRHHNGPGSYITAAVLSNASINFEEDGAIKIPWRPPPHAAHAQSGQLCTTLFNIVSRKEAAHIGMAGRTGTTDCDILYGEDFHHPVEQQFKALRESVSPIPPRVPTPPCRADSPAPSTISVTRSDPLGVRPDVQNLSQPHYSLSFKGGPYEFSMNAPNSDAQFLSFAKDVLQIGSSATAARIPALNANNPPMITGPVDVRSSVHMANQGTNIQYPMARTLSQSGLADPAASEHRHKRKAAEEAAPDGHRRPRKMDINSLLS